MANMTERLADLERRMQYVEEMLGVSPPTPTEKKKREPKQEPNPENTINGFGKEQLRVMFQWAKNVKLSQISKRDFEELKKWGMLWEFYPNAPENYEDIIL